MTKVKIKVFEDQIDEINLILQSKRSFWSLDSIVHTDYDDICQIIRIHIHKKFNQWNQELPFGPWASKIVNCQLINLKQKFYGKFAPPHYKCEFSEDSSKCCFFTNSCSECKEYSNWKRKKESAYNLMLAESSDKTFDEDPNGESRIKLTAEITPDYDRASSRLHTLILKELNPKMKKLYTWFFIENRSDEYVSAQMNYKSTEPGKVPGYRSISNFKRNLIDKAKEIMKKVDIFEN